MAETVVIDPRVAALMAKFEEEEVKQEQQLPKANLPKTLEEFLAAENLVRYTDVIDIGEIQRCK